MGDDAAIRLFSISLARPGEWPGRQARGSAKGHVDLRQLSCRRMDEPSVACGIMPKCAGTSAEKRRCLGDSAFGHFGSEMSHGKRFSGMVYTASRKAGGFLPELHGKRLRHKDSTKLPGPVARGPEVHKACQQHDHSD